MVLSERRIGEQVTQETRSYLLSFARKGETFARAVRSHWGIENSVHWVLDIAFEKMILVFELGMLITIEPFYVLLRSIFSDRSKLPKSE